MFNVHRCRRILVAGSLLLMATRAAISTAQPPQNNASLQSGIKTIDSPGGGHIYLGIIPGQPAPQDALGKTLHRLSAFCGDRPQLGKLVQNSTGEILAGFFTVTAKNQDSKPMAGLAMVYAPKDGTAGGAVLMDYADRFPSTVNALFATLKQELGRAKPGSSNPSASSAPAPAAPPQPLQRAAFPDGTGVIGLPAGWQVIQAHMGDVIATGPHGEKLRFGLTIPIMEPSGAGPRAMRGGPRGGPPGNFVAVSSSADPGSAYTSAIQQIARKAGKPAPDIEITKVQEIPMQGGRNTFLYGEMDVHDGQGKQFLVAQTISTTPQAMGAWQMTVFQVYGPDQTMAEERATVSAIFPSYSRDSRRVNDIVNVQIRQGIEQTNQFVGTIGRYMDASDRMTAGMSDLLREQTVIVDTETGGHARTSDDLAGLLVDANPNRFQALSPGQYVRGIDY